MSIDTNSGRGNDVLQLDGFMPHRLSVAAHLVSEVISTAYEQLFSLTIPEWRLIAVLGEKGELNQRMVSVATRMDKLTVSRSVASLVKRGLINRRANPADGRSQLIELTKKGVGLYRTIVPKARELEAQIFSGFSRDEMKCLDAMLKRIEERTLAITEGPLRRY